MTRLARLRQVLDEYLAATRKLYDEPPISDAEYRDKTYGLDCAKDGLYKQMTPETLEQLVTVAEAAAKEVTTGIVNDDLDDAVMPLLEEE